MSVADGDTLRAIDEGKAEHCIRLAGIDAPERGQPFGNVARERLAELTHGQVVTVFIDGRDRYGRTVAPLEVASLNRELVAEGLAWHFTRYSDDPTWPPPRRPPGPLGSAYGQTRTDGPVGLAGR